MWTPKSISGLALWLNDDVGVVQDPQHPGNVLHWLDQSGNGYTAMPSTPGTNYIAPSIDPQILNGHDAVKCADNGSLQVAGGPALDFEGGDFAIAVVFKPPPQGFETQTLWSQAQLSIGSTGGADLVYSVPPNQLAFPLVFGQFHILIAQGQALSLTIDGQTETGLTAGTISSQSVVVCADGDGNNGEVAEVVAVKGTLSAADAMKLQSYFKAKFAL